VSQSLQVGSVSLKLIRKVLELVFQARLRLLPTLQLGRSAGSLFMLPNYVAELLDSMR